MTARLPKNCTSGMAHPNIHPCSRTCGGLSTFEALPSSGVSSISSMA